MARQVIQRRPPIHVAALWMTLALANFWFLGWTVAEMLLTDSAADWGIIERAASLAGTAELYQARGTATFVWSPLAAYGVALITPLGLTVWRLLHVVFALGMPTWRLRLLVLVSWPFWFDVSTGNFLTLIFLTAVWAQRGSRLATLSFFALAFMIPRPLLAPLGLWILLTRPEWRVPFGLLLAVNAILVLWTGLAADWIGTVISVGPELQSFLFNVSPTRLLGNWWFALGIPLGVWLGLRGWLGLAGLAISPYVWPYYLLFGVLPRARQPATGEIGSRLPVRS